MNKRVWLAVTVALTVGMVGGVALDRGLVAQQSAISRKVVLTTDAPGGPPHEMVMAVVEIAPKGASGRHTHPGVEVGYVLEGTLEVARDGQPNETVQAGQAFKNDGVHNAINNGTKPAKLVAVYNVEKGKPMTTPVP